MRTDRTPETSGDPYSLKRIVGIFILRSIFTVCVRRGSYKDREKFVFEQRQKAGRGLIRQFINNGTVIVMDVDSGSVHVVDPVFYRAVQVTEPLVGELEWPELFPEVVKEAVRKELGSELPAEEVEEVIEIMQAFIGGEELLIKDSYQIFVHDFKARKMVVKALCLHIAYDCNPARRCCFVEEGEYHGRRALMSFEVGKKALDLLVTNLGARWSLRVDFFGGEPTMNWKVIRQLVEHGRSFEKTYDKKFRSTLTTNGVFLNDEITASCSKEMSNVTLSLDGRKEASDHMRSTRGGQGSYDIIVPKFQRFATERDKEYKDYYIRDTFTHNNLEFSEDVLHFADLGFKKMSMEPVVTDLAEPYATREEDLPVILEQYDKLAAEYVKRRREGKGPAFFHLQTDLKQGPCVAKCLSGYGPGTEYFAVTPWSNFYPCCQFVGREEFLLGNIDTGIQRSDICDEFRLCNVYAKPRYKDCEVRFCCSGGCAANSQNFHHNLMDAYEIGCMIQKKWIEHVVMIKTAEILNATVAGEAKAI